MEFICYNRCSTCRKAEKYLTDHNISFNKRDIVKQVPSVEELSIWIKKFNLDIDKLFNTSGLVYRELNLKEKKLSMTDNEKIKLLSSNGKLLKRPILVSDEIFINGFKEDEYNKIRS